MHRQLSHALGDGGVMTGHSAAITGSTEIFGGKEAEATHIPPAADGALIP